MTSRDMALRCARIAREHKAGDLAILDLRRLFVTDYFVVATVSSRPHARAIAEALLQEARDLGASRPGVEGLDEGAWVLVDLGDVVVHLFQPDSRRFYDLELLWGDARSVRMPAARAGQRRHARA